MDMLKKLNKFKIENDEDSLGIEYKKVERLKELEILMDENTLDFEKLTLEEQNDFL